MLNIRLEILRQCARAENYILKNAWCLRQNKIVIMYHRVKFKLVMAKLAKCDVYIA